MPDLSTYLNKDGSKVRIGFDKVSGYDISSFMRNEQVKVTEEELRDKKRIGGIAGVTELDGMGIQVDEYGFIKGDLKQIKLDLACGFSLPMQNADGNKVYMASSPAFINADGRTLQGRKGFPQSLARYYVEGIDSGPIKIGVGLDLDSWGTPYIAEHFPDTNMQSRHLVSLAEKGLLAAEIVVHSTTELSSSGKVFYANVISTAPGKGKVCYVSPYFCFGEYKKLGLDFALTEPGGVASSTQTTQMQSFVTTGYDYRTGNLEFTKNHLEAAMLQADKEVLDIGGSVKNCCRVRLFVTSLQEASEAIGVKIQKEFEQTNGKIDYAGGTVITTGNKIYSGNLQERICDYGKTIMEILTASCALYSQSHSGIAPVEKANTSELMKQHIRAANLKYAPAGLVTLAAKSAPSQLKTGKLFPTCDCSLYVSWVLMEAGVMKERATADTFLSGGLKLNPGYKLQSLNKNDPIEPGCILCNPGHVAISISMSHKGDFGGTKWWRSAIPPNETLNGVSVNRASWKGEHDCIQHEKEIHIFDTPQPIGSSWQQRYRIIQG